MPTITSSSLYCRFDVGSLLLVSYFLLQTSGGDTIYSTTENVVVRVLL